MLRTLTKRVTIALAICAFLLLIRFCVARLLGIHDSDQGGEASVIQGMFIVIDTIFSAFSMVPWAILAPSHRVNILHWQWFLALDFSIIGVIWGLTEALWKAGRKRQTAE
jgi:hypothetical protein